MTEPVIIGEHRYSASPQPEDFVLHTHDTYEILCFLSGNAEYVVEGHVYPLRRGDLMLMCRSETHRLAVRSAVPYERMTVSFSASALTPEERQRLLETAEMLNEKLERSERERKRDQKLLYESVYLPKIRRRYFRYKLKSVFSWGKKRKKYKRMKKALKEEIRTIGKMLDGGLV